MATEVKEENNAAPSDIKNDGDIDDEKIDSKAVDNSIKDDKDTVKNESKGESRKQGSDDDEEDDDDDDDEEEEEELALLDRPVEVTGCRARKKVERFNTSYNAPKEKKEIVEGKGKKLGDCPRIDAQIQKRKTPDLKPLHRVLYNRIGSANEIKRNIRKFSGFPFEKDSSEFARKKASIEKLVSSVLKQICEILDIERNGTKEEIVNRIMNFLLNPVDSGKKVEAKPKKRASKDKKKSSNKKAKTEKKAKTDKEEGSEDNESGEDDSTGGEASVGGSDEENEDASLSDEPKKKSKGTKISKAKSKAEKGKKEVKKTKATKRKADDSAESSEEEEQPAKKAKMPSDEEISKLVKEILDSADLQEITMKKVIKQVSDAFPDFDLTHKKAFIKSTIKSVIS